MTIMNQTTYRNHAVRSPIQYPARQRQATPVNQEDALRSHVRRLCNTLELSATFEEDAATLDTLNVSGLISVLCTLRKDGRIIGQGRGWSTVNRVNKSIDRSCSTAINGSFLSACNNACKILDALRLEEMDEQAAADRGAKFRDAYGAREHDSDLATEKQKAYARQLLSLNVEDEADREQIASTLDDMTKDEISSLIQRFAR